MKVNASVLVGCVTCVLLVAGIGMMNRMNKDQDQWSPNDIYHNVGGSSTSSVSSSVSSSAGVSVSMGSRSSRRYVAAPAFSYAQGYSAPMASTQYPIGGTPSNSVASPIYTTSSATYKSFGGGMVSGGGASVSGGSARSAASQPGIGVAGVSMPSMPSASAYSSAASASYLPATDGMLAVVNYYPGIGNTTASGPLGISGRRNAGGTVGGSFEGWFSHGYWQESGHELFGYDITEEDLRQLYIKITGDTDFSSEAQWLAFLNWFNSMQDDDTFGWYWVPISDAIPFVLLLCLAYGYVVYRRINERQKA